MYAMTSTMESSTITARELSRRTGEVLSAVASTGTPVTVTLGGIPQATIVPVRQHESHIDQMIRQGRIELPSSDWEKGARLPSLSLPDGMTTDRILDEDRQNRF